ncbi:MAG: PKD domain-containing protein [Verrucomicrobiota bacterium]
MTNCIVYGNIHGGSGPTNYDSCTFSYSDTDPLPAGVGNIDVDPQVLADGVHLAPTSLCIGAGTAGVLAGTDIDGQPWNIPPAIGCDEWQPAPLIGAQPTCQINSPLHGLTFNVVVAGQTPFSYFWSKDGLAIQNDGHYSNSGAPSLVVNHFGPDDAGLYQVVVTNAFGIVTSAVAQVVIHVVDAAGAKPIPPYSTWATAATNIQDAINIAVGGDIVLVTNGTYATGGKVMEGDLTNRVALDKPVFVTSVNGFAETVIQGAWDPVSTNGPGAVRCAWLASGAVLNGFTLENGVTRSTGDPSGGGPLESGGGVWCVDTNYDVVVSNCVLTNDTAIYGGGVAYGALNNSLVIGNLATEGGGAYYATLNNCTVVNNRCAALLPGPIWKDGGGTHNCTVRNCIVLNNSAGWPFPTSMDNYYIQPDFPARFSYSCTYPLASGTGNIDGNGAEPRFLDLFHIATTSPCRGAGSALYAKGTDLDGEAWTNPPSMGCDEVAVSNLVGPLLVNLLASQTNLLVSPPGVVPPHTGLFQGVITGSASDVTWLFGDGPVVTNLGASTGHQWTNTGDYTVVFTAYNNDNPSGVSTNTIVHVFLPDVPQLQPPVWLTNGLQFQFAGQSNANYTIQYATNLAPPVTWQTLQTISDNTEGTIQINDSACTNTARFYRVLAE